MSELPPPPPNWQPTTSATPPPPPPIEGWQPPGPPEPAVPPPPKPKKPINQNVGCAVIFLLLALVIAAVVGVASLPGDPPKQHAQWRAEINWGLTEVVDPATVNVKVSTKNIGKVAGIANCTITLNSRNGSYTGYDTFEVGRIGPGQRSHWNADITVTGEGAQYIVPDESSVTCEDK